MIKIQLVSGGLTGNFNQEKTAPAGDGVISYLFIGIFQKNTRSVRKYLLSDWGTEGRF